MVHVLDYFRKAYTKETEKHPEVPSTAISMNLPNLLFVPTWEYVCWLEARLSKYEQEPQLQALTTSTSTPSKGFDLTFLEEQFPTHIFFIDDKLHLYIDGRPISLKYSHPDEVNMNIILGEVPGQFVTTEEYLKYEILKMVTKYLDALKE